MTAKEIHDIREQLSIIVGAIEVDRLDYAKDAVKRIDEILKEVDKRRKGNAALSKVPKPDREGM